MSGETELRERAQLLDELRQIVQSMKNLAFAELQRMARMCPAQAQARDAVNEALRHVRADVAAADGLQVGATTWLVIGAERGFCGAFNARLVMALSELRQQMPSATLLVASHRLVARLESEAFKTLAVRGCAGSEEAEPVLDAWMDALNEAIQAGSPVWVMHVGHQGIVRQRLWPVDVMSGRATDGVAAVRADTAPQMYLPAPLLRDALSRQAMRLALQGALYASLDEENHWRLAQMQRAQDHLDDLGRKLRRRYATLRQSNITNELETLASSTLGINRS